MNKQTHSTKSRSNSLTKGMSFDFVVEQPSKFVYDESSYKTKWKLAFPMI